MWLRKADGSVDYANPFAEVGAIADSTFVTTPQSTALYYTQSSGGVHKISRAPEAFVDPGPLAFSAAAPVTRVLDTRRPEDGPKQMRGNTTRYVKLNVDPAVKAALVNFAFVSPSTPGYLTAWGGRTARTTVSNINAISGEVVANSAIVPLDANGGFLVYSFSTADVVIDVLGYFAAAPAAVTAGRFVAVEPSRLADTRNPVSATNQYSRGSGALDYVRVPVAGDGTVDLHLASVPNVAVDVAGYFTSASAPAATAGRFHVIQPHREVDTRIPEGFAPMPGLVSRTLNPTVVPDDAGAMAQTITIVDNVVPGFVTPYPGGPVPVVSAGNTNAANQIHAVLSFTKLSAALASMSYFTNMATNLVVDVPGYFEGG
jgi:hypothetical protein